MSMTQGRLSEIYWLPKEIRLYKIRISELQGTKIGPELEEYKELLNTNLRCREAELKALQNFLDGIDDPWVRELMILRYVKNFSWVKVAASVGGNSEDSVKKVCSRYMKECKTIIADSGNKQEK